MDGVIVNFIFPTMHLINKKLELLYLPDTEKNVAIVTEAFKTKENLMLAVETVNSLKRKYVEYKDMIPHPNGNKTAKELMRAMIRNNIEHWAGLPWSASGEYLWKNIKKYNPMILTTPLDTASRIGKRIWVMNNLNIPLERIIFSHNKSKYAINENGEPNILIDDFEVNTKPFEKKGGKAFLYKGSNAGKILKSLEENF